VLGLVGGLPTVSVQQRFGGAEQRIRSLTRGVDPYSRLTSQTLNQLCRRPSPLDAWFSSEVFHGIVGAQPVRFL
jgi:hypothetical protein